jgi:hypothetical protein
MYSGELVTFPTSIHINRGFTKSYILVFYKDFLFPPRRERKVSLSGAARDGAGSGRRAVNHVRWAAIGGRGAHSDHQSACPTHAGTQCRTDRSDPAGAQSTHRQVK